MKIGFYIKWNKHSLHSKANVIGDELFGESLCKALRKFSEVSDAQLYAPNYIPDDLLDKFTYPLGEMIITTDIHPNGCLVKYTDSAAIYLVENGKKRQFTSWNAFVSNGYKSRPILIIPDTEIYETTEVISALAESLTTPVFAAFSE